MATALSSSSSSSSSVPMDGFTYDVFLSFRGIDTRHGFTGNLYKALKDKGIRAFFDKEDIPTGEEITPSLLQAIEQSRTAIIVLSPHYATSSFCLNELSHILDCIKGKGRLVWPVFYDVDPSDVRWLKKTYGEAMDMHEASSRYNTNTMQKWKNTLQQVANLSGTPFKNGGGYEYEFVEHIVKEVSRQIKPFTLYVAEYLVGLESPKQDVISLLNVGSGDEVHMVGIHGIGGIGKTTLALEVYNSIAYQFEGSCFLGKVRENSEKHGLTYLQKILLSKTIGEKEIELTSVNEGIAVVQQRLQKKKVLLILDDVGNIEQLKAIVGKLEWFGPGSRVIITTRDTGLLISHGVKSTYEVKELNKEDALKLLRWKAFNSESISSSCADVLNLLERAITIASSLPLALEVIGSHLFKIGIEEWEYALDQYERIPNKTIQKVLEESFNTLEREEKSAFLDIACCFKGYELAMVERILHAHLGDSTKGHIRVLVEKSLIKINESGDVTLHDLIEDMGKEIVRRESPEEPRKRSRLWHPEDIVQVLEENMGTSKIEMIYLDSWIEVNWDGELFKRTKNLRTLIIKGDCHFSRSPKYLPNSLRILDWQGYPSSHLPHDFYPKKLVICKLAYNELTSIRQGDLFKKEFKNMKILNIDHSIFLTKIPDVSGLPNLEEFSFQYCDNLIIIDDSVVSLGKLKILRANNCKKVMSFPPLKLASLEELYLSCCESLQSFPAVVDVFLDKLKILKVDYCWNLKSFPPLKLASLEVLDISYNVNLESFPPVVDGLLSNLKTLYAYNCEKLKSFPPLMLASLEELDISYCNGLESFPPVVDGLLDKVKILYANGCKNLKSFPLLKLTSLERLDISYCDSLESFPHLVDDGLVSELKILCANNCLKLRSFQPLKLASLEKLDISHCDSLESFPPVADGLLEKLKILSVNNCLKLKSFPPLKLVSLEQLDISHCDSLESFPPLGDGMLEKLKILRAKSCKKLKSFPPLKLASLEKLDLSNCYSLESFPPLGDGLLEKLKILHAESCKKLKSFPPLKLASLENLDLSHCYSLESFPPVADGLLEKLKILSVNNCLKLKCFPPLKLASLEQLDISHCDSLESFPPVGDGMLEKLKILRAKSCKKLKSFPPLKLASLEKLDLSYCYSLESFPPVVDGLLCKLKILRAECCWKLRSFPPLKLVSLKELDISYCRSLESFTHMVDGLPGKLKIFNVVGCNMLRSVPPLVSPLLKQLHLSYCDNLESFPELLGEMENITKLQLENTPIKELPFSFRNLTQLRRLYLIHCGIVRLPSSIVEMSELVELIIVDGGWLFPKQDEGEERVSLMQSSQVELLHLWNCKLSDESLAIGLKWFTNVKELNLSGSKFTTLPECIEKCQFLGKLILEDCEELQEINGIPPSLKVLSAMNCNTLTMSCKSKLLNQELHEAGDTWFCLPGEKIPEWVDHQCMQGQTISFWFCNRFPAIALCVVPPLTWSNSKSSMRVIINGSISFYKNSESSVKLSKTYHLHLFDMQMETLNDDMDKALLENKWNHAEIDLGFPCLKSGIHVLKEKSSMEDIRFTNPENDFNTGLTL